MDVAILYSPATYAAAGVVFLCCWAALVSRNAADRLIEASDSIHPGERFSYAMTITKAG